MIRTEASLGSRIVSSGKGRKLEMRHSARKPGLGQERGAGGEEAEVRRDPPQPGGWPRFVGRWWHQGDPEGVFRTYAGAFFHCLVVEQLWNPDCESALIKLLGDCLEG